MIYTFYRSINTMKLHQLLAPLSLALTFNSVFIYIYLGFDLQATPLTLVGVRARCAFFV